MDSITGSVDMISDGTLPTSYIYRAELPSKGEDRTVVLPCEHGIIIAIFDGHCGSQLSEFAAEKLPVLLSERLRENVDVEAVMRDTIQDFDRSLLLPVLALFDENENWSDPKWLDTEREVYPRIGCTSKDERYKAGIRATVGSTALIAFLDRQRKHLWVASLGDCDAVCGRRKDDKWTQIFLSERYNCDNPDEIQRLGREHPNEPHVIQDDSLLGTLRVTRALGDHQLKAPFFMATRVLPHFSPARLEPSEILDWGVWTPPYMLSTPSIRHHDVLPGDLLLFASDGLRDVIHFPDERKFDIVLSLADGNVGHDIPLGHECIPAQEGDNVAQRVIANVLFGTDDRKRARELDKRTYRDDISLVIISLK
ncbi:Protein serine threonine phosphatase 2C [Mycena venus]|uniref:Protein serine threonine phosphatase 2C n=1 Tax=Mycena venus TaxID=2733690 RepID=A0A8H6XXU0_9AGAR|nr:Protein serine threonine phosphatase 2C [Mycena venus]